jgi:hypothetical protein
MAAMLQEDDFQQEASLRGTRGEAFATIAIWSVPERRSEHEFKSAFSTHAHSNKLSINNKLETLGARGGLLAWSQGVRCKWASGRNRKIRMGNTVSLRDRAVPIPASGKLTGA